METQAVGQSGAAVGGSNAAPQIGGNATLSKNDFLRLLVTQLTHQDPLNPLDQNQFLSQTAQFTQLETLQNIAKAIDGLTTASAASSVAQAAGLLGKTVKAAGSDFAYDGSGAVALPYAVDGPAASIQIDVMSEDGTRLRTITTETAGSGTYTATWDGKDTAGHPVTAGTYYYRVSVPSGASGTVVSASQGVLTGFAVTGGAVRYQLGTAHIRPEDIIQVGQAS
jgi:flagellar basal-body rod modification protein FlgD